MSQRRLFSPDIICSDEFLDMPTSSRDLYVQLAIRADDDGFVRPYGVMKIAGSSDDDLKILISKRFILEFQSGVIVIKHWLIHNTIRKDRYKKTRFIEEKSMLRTKENGAYTEYSEDGNKLLPSWQPNGNQMAAQVKLSEVKEIPEIRISDSSEEDVSYVETDEDGIEIKRKVKKTVQTNKSKIAMRLVKDFMTRVNKINTKVLIQERAGYILSLKALEAGFTEKNIENLFDDWFNSKPDEEVISITAALSLHNLNQFRLKEGI
jgi:hypothetical protein